MRPRAFTLIEVIAVVMLLGLLTGATAWVMTEDAQRSSTEAVIGQIAHLDRMARFTARRLGRPGVLQFDLDAQQVRRLHAGGGESGRQILHTLKLPGEHRIDQIVASMGFAATGRMESANAGAFDVPYSTDGRSSSYAVRLVSTGGDRWMVFAGTTGQVTFIDDERKVNNLFAMLATGRPDPR